MGLAGAWWGFWLGGLSGFTIGLVTKGFWRGVGLGFGLAIVFGIVGLLADPPSQQASVYQLLEEIASNGKE